LLLLAEGVEEERIIAVVVVVVLVAIELELTLLFPLLQISQ
jgi:hypothetical protein